MPATRYARTWSPPATMRRMWCRAMPRPLPDDTVLVAVSERMVAITQGRSLPDERHPAGPAGALPGALRHASGVRHRARHRRDDAAGDRRGRCCRGSCWRPRVSAVTKPFGVHGLFYRVAGPQAAAIDGPTSYTIPPYNQSATLGPKDPDGPRGDLAAAIGRPVAVIDANDAGCNVLGCQPGLERRFVERLFADNPLGQAASRRRSAWSAASSGPPASRCRRSRSAA